MEQLYFTFGEREFLLRVAHATVEAWVYRQEVHEPQTVNQKLWTDYQVTVSFYYGRKLLSRSTSGERQHALILAVRDHALAGVKAALRLVELQSRHLATLRAEIVVNVPDVHGGLMAVVFSDSDAKKLI